MYLVTLTLPNTLDQKLWREFEIPKLSFPVIARSPSVASMVTPVALPSLPQTAYIGNLRCNIICLPTLIKAIIKALVEWNNRCQSKTTAQSNNRAIRAKENFVTAILFRLTQF